MEDDKLRIIDENGKEKEYSILFMFSEKEYNEDYIVYTDYSIDENGNINVYSNIYKEENGRIELFPVERQEVRKFIDQKLEDIINEILDKE